MTKSILLSALFFATVLFGDAVAQDEKKSPQSEPASQPTVQKSIHGFEVVKLDGQKTKLDAFKGKTCLVVNTASKCGLTPQYEGLQKLYETYKDKDFVILGFPSNDFGKQEPGTDGEIATFCKSNYGVTFPMFSKIVVKGDGQAPLYKFLTTESGFPGDVKWNFQKYLVDAEGHVVAMFDPRTKPDDPKLIAAVESSLPTKKVPGKKKKVIGGSPTAAADALAAAQKKAETEQKVVFVHFRADWCGWCKKLEAFIALPDIKPIFDRRVVDLEIDTEKMADGQALLEKFTSGKATGIPFWAFVKADGTIAANAFDDKGENVGYPFKPVEVAAFMKAWKASVTAATPEETAAIEAKLTELGEKKK